MANESMISLNVNLGSTKDVEASFNALVKTLEAKKVKLEVDTSSIRASLSVMSSEIEQMYKRDAEAKRNSENEKLRVMQQSNAQAMAYLKQQQAEVKKTYGVDSKLTFNQNPDTKQITSAMISFTNEVGKAETKMYSLNEDIIKFASSGEKVKSIKLAPVNEKITSDLVKVNSELDKIITGSQKVSDTMNNKMSKVTMGNEWVKSLDSFKSFQTMLGAFDPNSLKQLKTDSYDLAQAWKLVQQEVDKVKVGDKVSSEFNKAQKSLDSFKNSMGKKINLIEVGKDGGMASQLQVFDQLKTKLAELQNFKLTTSNVSEYIEKAKEINSLYDQTQVKIKAVNSAQAEMNKATTIDSNVTNKIKDLNAQLDIMLMRNSALASNPAFQKLRQDVESLKTVPVTEFNNSVKDITRNMSTLRAETTSSTGVFAKLGQSIKSAFSFMSVSMIMYKFATQVREIPSEIIKLDTALVDLKKTAKMANDELDEFYKTSNTIAKSLGVTTEEIIKQASAWSRLGYSTKEQVETMAQVSAIFKSISPGMDMDTSTDGLVSAMKAFNISADEALDSIASKINIVGNTQAVNNEDIVEFLTRSSSAMAEANNTLSETIALGTAATEITRDASSVGNALKTKIVFVYRNMHMEHI